MTLLDYHILLGLADEARYGYALKEAVAADSGGALTPPAGSLYRAVGRLMTEGLVVEAAPPSDAQPHPGLARRYYALTPAGRRALSAEAARLKQTAHLAERRLGMVDGRP